MANDKDYCNDDDIVKVMEVFIEDVMGEKFSMDGDLSDFSSKAILSRWMKVFGNKV